MRLLYGDRVGFQPGWGLAIWSGGLLLAAACSALLSVASFIGAQTPDATEVQLLEWGVIEPGEGWLAAVSDDEQGQSGCVLTRRAVVRWKAGEPEERIALTEEIHVEQANQTLRVSSPQHSFNCPLKEDSLGLSFQNLVQARSKRKRTRWRPSPDPRVAHLFDARESN